MANPTPYLPGFSHRLCGRRAVSVASRIGAQARSLDGLAALVARFILNSAVTREVAGSKAMG